MFKRPAAIALVVILCLTFGSCNLFQTSGEQIDPTKFDFKTQLSPPKEGEQIAVVTTTMGTIKMKFFPQYAPKAVKNFVTLAKEGYYNGTYVFCVNTDMAFMGGSADKQGIGYKSIFNDGKPFDNEYTDALWHFSGSVSAISGEKDKGDSRFFVIGNCPVKEDNLKSMEKTGYPEALIDMYNKNGGLPTLDRRHPVFAQVYEGMEVVDRINKVKTDAQTGVPIENIMIEKIEIKNYGE